MKKVSETSSKIIPKTKKSSQNLNLKNPNPKNLVKNPNEEKDEKNDKDNIHPTQWIDDFEVVLNSIQ